MHKVSAVGNMGTPSHLQLANYFTANEVRNFMGREKSYIKEKSDLVLGKKPKQLWKRFPRRAVEFLSLEVSKTQVDTSGVICPHAESSPALSDKLEHTTSPGPLKVQSFYVYATLSLQSCDECQARR